MMKEEALYQFYNSFGIPAYERNSVPADAEFPYLTYELITDSFDHPVIMTASLWYKDKIGYSALRESVLKKNEISSRVGEGGTFLKCDGGKIWLQRGTPFAQVMGDDTDDKIKRQIINITAEYFTVD